MKIEKYYKKFNTYENAYEYKKRKLEKLNNKIKELNVTKEIKIYNFKLKKIEYYNLLYDFEDNENEKCFHIFKGNNDILNFFSNSMNSNNKCNLKKIKKKFILGIKEKYKENEKEEEEEILINKNINISVWFPYDFPLNEDIELKGKYKKIKIKEQILKKNHYISYHLEGIICVISKIEKIFDKKLIINLKNSYITNDPVYTKKFINKNKKHIYHNKCIKHFIITKFSHILSFNSLKSAIDENIKIIKNLSGVDIKFKKFDF